MGENKKVDTGQKTNDVGHKTKIQSFTDLEAWRSAHALYVSIYSATKVFPKDEMFGITSQIRRASLSVSSNIAEGFGRSPRSADRVHFYTMARGSLTEVQNQLFAGRDVELLTRDTFEELYNKSIVTHKLLNGLINATKGS
jgi:four helix bundle protein